MRIEFDSLDGCFGIGFALSSHGLSIAFGFAQVFIEWCDCDECSE